MRTTHLGKNSKKINKKGIDLLDVIERSFSNAKFGIDIWNVYDFMYLDKKNIPLLKVLEISIPSSSKYLIESKSMKLYLNDFYNKSFKNKYDVIDTIKNDLSNSIGCKVKTKFVERFSGEPKFSSLNSFSLKKTKPNNIYKFNGFRSICPVTSQPDFANIYIYSDSQINTKWLLDYLISFKDHGGFHEQCIDLIYNEIQKKYNVDNLEICGRFQRRGGIDINPIRGNQKKVLFSNFREFNQ